MTEVIVTVGIVGILSSIALPNYFRQIQRTHQAEANATMSQMMATIAAFNDEFGTHPDQWDDLNAITTLMTHQGPATTDDRGFDEAITLPGKRYTLIRNKTDKRAYYIFEAKAINEAASKYNIFACINLTTGASDQIIGGRNNKPAKKSCLACNEKANETECV
nr:pilin [Synechococcus sp. WH 8020]